MMDLMHSLAQEQQQQQQPSDGSTGSSEDGSDKYAPLSLAQRQRLKQQVLTWLQHQHQPSKAGTDLQQPPQQELSSLAPMPLHNVRQLRELLYAYKVGAHE